MKAPSEPTPVFSAKGQDISHQSDQWSLVAQIFSSFGSLRRLDSPHHALS
jgi:hypothetical protein